MGSGKRAWLEGGLAFGTYPQSYPKGPRRVYWDNGRENGKVRLQGFGVRLYPKGPRT